MPDSPLDLLRIAVVVAVLLLLVRAARAAWARRPLAVSIWRAIRPRHLLGALGLIVIVLGTAVALLVVLPVTGLGAGALVGLEGNAIFAPIDSALDAPLQQAPAPGSGLQVAADPSIPWADVTLVTGFLTLLVLLFPHLAHTEEAVFRAGWEDLTLPQQALSALRFGLVHLIMLIPIAAALAIGVAGFAYGRIYRRAYRRAAVPRTVLPTGRLPLVVDAEGFSRLAMGPPSPVLLVDRTAARRQAVFEAAVWHTTFNTTIAGLVWLGYILSLIAA